MSAARTFQIHRVEYFYCTVKQEPNEAYELLSQLARLGVNLLAFTAVPMGPSSTELTLFPEDALRLQSAARKAGLVLIGPYSALLVQGDDELGALAGIHARLHAARVDVYASSGVTDGRGHYGYVIYLRPEEFERAVAALEGVGSQR
jgi:hypothetical protein